MSVDAAPWLPVVAEPQGWDRPVRHAAVHVLFTDGSWRPARVSGWRRVSGLWFVRLAWRSGRFSWHAYDSRYIHPA